MLDKIKPSAKLYMLVFVLGVVIVGIGAYGISKMKSMNGNTQTMYADRVLPLEQLTSMRYAYATGILSTVEELKNNTLTVTQAEQQINKAEESITENWQAYQRTYLVSEEVELVKQIELLKVTADKTTDKLKQNLKKSNTATFKNVADRSMYEAVNPVLNKLNELIQLQIKVSSELNQSNNEAYRSTKNKFLVLIAVALLFAFVLSFIILKDVWSLVTNLRESNKKITESEKKCRTLIENTADAIFMINEETFIVDVNDYGCRLLGYSREELLRMKISDIVPPDEREKQGSYLKLIRKNRSALTERRLRRKDGSEVEVEVNSQILDRKGHVAIVRDITERKKIEEEKRKSEQNYSSLFEQASDMIVLTDLKGDILEVNNSGSYLLGYTRQEMIGRNTALFIEPKQLKNEPLTIPQLQEGAHVIRRRKVVKKNGEVFELESNTKRIFGDRFLIIARDITELRKAELQIAASEEKYRALTENISDAIVLTDKDNRPVYRSPSLERLTGYTNEEAESMSMFDFIHADALEMTTESFMKSFNAPGVPVQFSTKIVTKNGDALWIEGTSLNLLHDESIKGIVTNFRDVTERKKAEEKLRESSERYKSIISVSNTGAWEYHTNMDYLWCSPEYFSMLGRNRDDFNFSGSKNLQETWVDLLHPDDRERSQNHFAEYLKNGSEGMYESYFRLQHKNGNWIWIWSRGQTLRDAEGNLTNLTVGTHIDITERKKAEEEINSLNETLEQKVIDRTSQLLEANKALEAFSYSVTHDLRAPLRAIIGFSGIIQKEHAARFDYELKELFEYIGSSALRMNAIIDDMLALAKYEKATLRPAPVDMERLMKRVWDGLQHSMPHRATLEIKPLPHALGDESLLEQVVVNLLSNAVKYSSKKDKPVVMVDYENGDGVVTFCVNDNGAGFDMKNYNRLFGAFQRLHGMSEFEGTGVGLLLVKRIIERHGGVVWAESKVDEGATFYFTLPGNN